MITPSNISIRKAFLIARHTLAILSYVTLSILTSKPDYRTVDRFERVFAYARPRRERVDQRHR